MRRKPGELLPIEEWLLANLDKASYAYELQKAATSGYKPVASGTMTRALQRLEGMGKLKSWQEIIDGRARRYYQRRD